MYNLGKLKRRQLRENQCSIQREICTIHCMQCVFYLAPLWVMRVRRTFLWAGIKSVWFSDNRWCPTGLVETQSRDLSLLLSFKLDEVALVRRGRGRKQEARSHINAAAPLCRGTKGPWIKEGGLDVIFLSAWDSVRKRQAKSKDQRFCSSSDMNGHKLDLHHERLLIKEMDCTDRRMRFR